MSVNVRPFTLSFNPPHPPRTSPSHGIFKTDSCVPRLRGSVPNEQRTTTMSSPSTSPTTPTKRGITCSGCGGRGHNVRTCPTKTKTKTEPAPVQLPPPASSLPQPEWDTPTTPPPPPPPPSPPKGVMRRHEATALDFVMDGLAVRFRTSEFHLLKALWRANPSAMTYQQSGHITSGDGEIHDTLYANLGHIRLAYHVYLRNVRRHDGKIERRYLRITTLGEDRRPLTIAEFKQT